MPGYVHRVLWWAKSSGKGLNLSDHVGEDSGPSNSQMEFSTGPFRRSSPFSALLCPATSGVKMLGKYHYKKCIHTAVRWFPAFCPSQLVCRGGWWELWGVPPTPGTEAVHLGTQCMFVERLHVEMLGLRMFYHQNLRWSFIHNQNFILHTLWLHLDLLC